MSLREDIARWICPELGIRADRYTRLIAEVHEAYRWLGGYGHIPDFCRWLWENDRNVWRKIDEDHSYTKPYLPSRIDEFREYLKRKETEVQP